MYPWMQEGGGSGGKRVASYRASLVKQQAGFVVSVHKQKLDEAVADVLAKLAALEGQTEHQAYVDMENAIAGLKRVIEAGSEAGRVSKAYGKRLAAEIQKLTSYRAEMRKLRVSANENVAKGRIEVYESAPTPETSARAKEAISTLLKVIEAGRSFKTKDKKYGQFLAAAEKRAKGYSKSLDKKAKAEPAAEETAASEPTQEEEEAPKPKVAANKTLTKALAAAMKKMGVLKKKASKKNIDAAQAAVDALDDALAEASSLAKSKKHGKLYAKAKKAARSYKATLEKKRGN